MLKTVLHHRWNSTKLYTTEMLLKSTSMANSELLQDVYNQKLLGTIIDKRLTFESQIDLDTVCSNITRRISVLKLLSRCIDKTNLNQYYQYYKRIGYNINIMRQSACLVFNPITVNCFASFFNCTPVDRASDSMMAPT